MSSILCSQMSCPVSKQANCFLKKLEKSRTYDYKRSTKFMEFFTFKIINLSICEKFRKQPAAYNYLDISPKNFSGQILHA